MKSIARCVIVSAMVLSAVCCRRTPAAMPVPRPEAYPRIETYSSDYKSVDVGDVTFPVNASTIVNQTRSDAQLTWLDVSYPRYGATLHLTLAHYAGESLLEALSNRYERMALNVGSVRADVASEISSSGVTSTIVVSPHAVVTPVQMLSTDSTTFLLSAVLEIHRDSLSAEAIAPVVDAVATDMVNMSHRISRRR